MTFRIAVVQPIAHRPGADENNVAEAVATIAAAATQGAHFVCFPETYPGPWRMPMVPPIAATPVPMAAAPNNPSTLRSLPSLKPGP